MQWYSGISQRTGRYYQARFDTEIKRDRTLYEHGMKMGQRSPGEGKSRRGHNIT